MPAPARAGLTAVSESVAESVSSPKLRIVHTEASCGWGGQEIRILSEAAGFLRRGHGVHLLCPPQAHIYDEARRRGLPVTALPIARKSLRGLLAMHRWLRANPVDIVNTHSSTDAWLVAISALMLRRPPPMVRTRHISAPVPGNSATRWLYTRATRHIVTTGERLRETLVHENGFPAERITSIPTGIDTEKFVPGDKAAARRQLRLPLDVPIIGIIATLRSWKGHRYLIEAMAPLRHKNMQLVIVGDGPQRGAIQSQVNELNLNNQVILAGNQPDVLPWLQALDIFVLPSYANEGVPQAVLQAMACGLPVVTTPVGSIGEAVKDEDTGLVVQSHCTSCLSAAIERLMSSPDLRQKLGTAAIQFVQANFGINRMLDRMEAVFQENRALP
ncbi:MAG: glycosyltransferase family 4 protein [Gammaproteobacteria bacterium]|nr:glycosyltransferase family 4 protein [Gammaproteobacteria bacterium]MDH3370070.1 glycosyltransferase family 4 protein [Gammaproteobacteria bacterium]MDH3562143.1 glycosyltransferase family 4 protein [Gammaproteobacteria bacterium]MDH5486518.1 glycosyltransferase family 4 protein [Gammaproteobacteria bacterium]